MCRAAWAIALVLLVATTGEAVNVRELHVSPKGRDTWPGTKARPLATLEAARDRVRLLKQQASAPGPFTVWLRAGRYELAQPFALTKQDSGAAGRPIVYRAWPKETVRLVGGKSVTNFVPTTDPAVLARLEPAARGQVWQADLRALGVTDFGEVKNGGLELFFNDRPMTLARWPNQGFTQIADVVGGKPLDVRGTIGDETGVFTYEGDRPTRWAQDRDVWLHGYWFWDWSDEREKVQSIDTTRRVISLAPPYHTFGYRKGQWYYAFNLLSELDTPGEWYLDRETGVLYFWPPSPLAKGRTVVSVLPHLVTMEDASYVVLRGLTLESARGTAVTIRGGQRAVVRECVIRNVGGDAVAVSGGTRHGVVGCEIYATGNGGILLDGGDRATLTPAGHYAEDNHIHHYSRWNRMYQPAVGLSGVGNRASHNFIHDAPHQAIAFSGNDHLIEYNEIHDVCTESNDAGAIYSGRDWTWRGNRIVYNVFRDIHGYQQRGSMGVYLDDMLCGTTIYGNLFVRVTQAAFIGGGRDNVIENNLFVDCKPAVHIDARAVNWASYHVGTTMTERLKEMPYQQPPWSTRYPALVNILAEEPAAPRGNRVARNLCAGGEWLDLEGEAKPYVQLEDNLVAPQPGFVDAAHGDYRLRADSPARAMGFRPLPLGKVGPRVAPDKGRGVQP